MIKIKLTVFLLVLLFLPTYTYGQNDRGDREKPHAVFFAPLNLLDFRNPNIQIGYERLIAKKWTVQIEGGIIINHSLENYLIDMMNGTKYCPYTNKGFRVAAGIKYIVLDRKNIKLYLSPELFYGRNKSGNERDFVIADPDYEYSEPRPEGATRYAQFFYNDERKTALSFKVGVKLFAGDYFAESYLGMGVAHRNVIRTGVENPNDEPELFFGMFDNVAPDKWVLTIPFNLKIGFRF